MTLTQPINKFQPIEINPYLMDEEILLKLKFISEKNIEFLKEY